MTAPIAFLIAFLAGIAPTGIWLSFWLLEDRCDPEPKRYIFYSFALGMLAVALALPLEQYAESFATGFGLYLSWAAIEELLKFGAAYLAALRLPVFDEPLSGLIYLVTAALGFSFVENTLFLMPSIMDGNLLRAVATGDLRFIGATLVHTLASGVIGIALGLTYYAPASVRRLAALGGLILAILLHAYFNFFILKAGSSGTFFVFFCIWIGIIALLMFTERIKLPERDYC